MKPDYWDSAAEQLAKADPVMCELVARYSGMSLAGRGDAFGTLARSIVGQQISVKAADSVWSRFIGATGHVTPAAVAAMSEPVLRQCGLSARKVEYLQDLAAHFLADRINPLAWRDMPDREVISQLCTIRGIGVWTAEMFLIFNLMRPDVFPVDDKGLQKAVVMLYADADAIRPERLKQYGERWRPWRTVATWLLWRSLDPVPVEY